MHDTGGQGAVVADAYALGDGDWAMEPVARGALGQIWKLTRKDAPNGPAGGTAWAVKELLFDGDEEQVLRESALRGAAERLGIASPRLFADRAGACLTRLGGSPHGPWVKLYEWVDGVPADASDPEILSWCGRTLAALHRAGAEPAGTPDPWYERCPSPAEWAQLHSRVRRAGVPWSDALGRFVASAAGELARHVTASVTDGVPADGEEVVVSHLDVKPQNVLVGPRGPVLLDWDNAGPTSAGRELAQAAFVWSGGNDFHAGSARRLVRAYREAGGHPVLRGLGSFSMLFATALNYVRVQAECAIDPAVTPAQREFASGQVVASLRDLPDPAAVARLAECLKAAW
ncbi:phosphotransferase enzyme family protein [Streptomyces sp. NBC_00199]|uniref:phosphotransferase enzyme family protein n=1 Tax=Streptomyces sp. NBC_00199 TaxID=2975678 RepID=UPI00225128AD|nr:aminoglycoside phosphotransferase family protein [Streptomyces sp. NBC_00199]MCX5263003.1 aminoglycoside phosphotransferase family protein [Streptomyces sp. NBC_00199]